MFYLFYLTLTAVLAVLAAPIIIILSQFKPKYRSSLPARFFLFKNPPPPPKTYHFHAASLGEVAALIPIIRLLGEEHCRLTAITQTGFTSAKKSLKCPVNYLPFEPFLPFWLPPCDTLIVFEAELWLSLLKTAKNRGARTILLNARISDRSYPRYRKFAWFYRHIFANIDLILAQSPADEARLKELGAQVAKITGNIKSALAPAPKIHYPKPRRPLLTIASTHEGEEARILAALAPLFKGPAPILAIAPRHPERFGTVRQHIWDFCEQNGLKSAAFSEQNIACLNADIALIDTLGELINLYEISDLVVLGGSFEPKIGGHNPIEIAQFGAPIISGKHIFNQKPLFELVSGAVFADYDTLLVAVKTALNEPKSIKTTILKRCNLNDIINHIKGSK